MEKRRLSRWEHMVNSTRYKLDKPLLLRFLEAETVVAVASRVSIDLKVIES
jgi:hypothetical protein